MSKVREERELWYVYVLRCANGSLYTGIATNIRRRISEHQHGKGAKYLRGKGPLRLVFKKAVGDKGLALRVESRIKKLPKLRKESLVKQRFVIDEIIDQAKSPRRVGASMVGATTTRKSHHNR